MDSDDERLEIVETLEPPGQTVSCDDDSGVVADDTDSCDVNCIRKTLSNFQNGRNDTAESTTSSPSIEMTPISDDCDSDGQDENAVTAEDILTAEALQLDPSVSDHSKGDGGESSELEEGELDGDDEDDDCVENNPVDHQERPGDDVSQSTHQISTELDDEKAELEQNMKVRSNSPSNELKKNDEFDENHSENADKKLQQNKRKDLDEEDASDETDDDNCVYVVGASPTKQRPCVQFQAASYSYAPNHEEGYIGRLSPQSAKRRKILKKHKMQTCHYFLMGHCQKGEFCDFAHEELPPPPLRMKLCKFYARECCAKRAECKYLHKEFPCKMFHTGARCFSDTKCKFSHDPLSETTEKILIKHIETAPSDILGDFPRLSRPEILHRIDSAKQRRDKGEEPSFTFDNIDHTRYTHLVKEPTTGSAKSSSRSVNRATRRPLRAVSGGGRQPGSVGETCRRRERRGATDRSPERRERRRRSRERHRRHRADRDDKRRRRRAKKPAEAAPAADVSHLPASQRQLYMRIQHNQKNNVPRETTPQPTNDGSGEPVDSWYSSDEEGLQPLTDLLKKISAQSIGPSVTVQECRGQEGAGQGGTSADAMDMETISDLLKQIQSSTEKESRHPGQSAANHGGLLGRSSDNPHRPAAACNLSGAAHEWTTANFHDVIWGGEMSPERHSEPDDQGHEAATGPGAPATAEQVTCDTTKPPPAEGQTSANQISAETSKLCPLSVEKDSSMCENHDAEVNLGGGLDVNAPSAGAEGGQVETNTWLSFQSNCTPGDRMEGSDNDDLSLPFKPVFLMPCIEIDASSGAHPPLSWRLTPVWCQGADYARLRARLGEALSRTDPRLRLLRRRSLAHKDSSTRQPGKKETQEQQKDQHQAVMGEAEKSTESPKSNKVPHQEETFPERKDTVQNSLQRQMPHDPRLAARREQLQRTGEDANAPQRNPTDIEFRHTPEDQIKQSQEMWASSGSCPPTQGYWGMIADQNVQNTQMMSAGMLQHSQNAPPMTPEQYQHFQHMHMMNSSYGGGAPLVESHHNGYDPRQQFDQQPQLFTGQQQPPQMPFGSRIQDQNIMEWNGTAHGIDAAMPLGVQQQTGLSADPHQQAPTTCGPAPDTNGHPPSYSHQQSGGVAFNQTFLMPMEAPNNLRMHSMPQQQPQMFNTPNQMPNMIAPDIGHPFGQPPQNGMRAELQQGNQMCMETQQGSHLSGPNAFQSGSNSCISFPQQQRNLGPMLPPSNPLQMQIGSYIQSATNSHQIPPLISPAQYGQHTPLMGRNAQNPGQYPKNHRQRNNSRRARRNRLQALHRHQFRATREKMKAGSASGESASEHTTSVACQDQCPPTLAAEVHTPAEELPQHNEVAEQNCQQVQVQSGQHEVQQEPHITVIPENKGIHSIKQENSGCSNHRVSDQEGNRPIFSPHLKDKQKNEARSVLDQEGAAGALAAGSQKQRPRGREAKVDAVSPVLTRPRSLLGGSQLTTENTSPTEVASATLSKAPSRLTSAITTARALFPSLAAAGGAAPVSQSPAAGPRPPLLGRPALVPAVLSRRASHKSEGAGASAPGPSRSSAAGSDSVHPHQNRV